MFTDSHHAFQTPELLFASLNEAFRQQLLPPFSNITDSFSNGVSGFYDQIQSTKVFCVNQVVVEIYNSNEDERDFLQRL